MKKKKILKIVKIVLKYLVPVVVGWLEGDTHAVAETFSDLLSLL